MSYSQDVNNNHARLIGSKRCAPNKNGTIVNCVIRILNSGAVVTFQLRITYNTTRILRCAGEENLIDHIHT
jgi:hypothetical protein